MKKDTNILKDKYIIYKENKNKIGIYKLINDKNGKSYVRSSTNIDNRLFIYFSKKAMLNQLNTRKSNIYNALLKYDYASFSLEILEYCEKDVLIKREQYYIDKLKPEYNNLKAAKSRLSSKHTIETKTLMSIKQSGVNHHFYGKTHKYETRKRISEGLKFRIKTTNRPSIITLETILKMLPNKGVKIKVFYSTNKLMNEFSSRRSVAKYFNSSTTVRRYLDKNKSYNGFIFRS